MREHCAEYKHLIAEARLSERALNLSLCNSVFERLLQ